MNEKQNIMEWKLDQTYRIVEAAEDGRITFSEAQRRLKELAKE